MFKIIKRIAAPALLVAIVHVATPASAAPIELGSSIKTLAINTQAASLHNARFRSHRGFRRSFRRGFRGHHRSKRHFGHRKHFGFRRSFRSHNRFGRHRFGHRGFHHGKRFGRGFRAGFLR